MYEITQAKTHEDFRRNAHEILYNYLSNARELETSDEHFESHPLTGLRQDIAEFMNKKISQTDPSIVIGRDELLPEKFRQMVLVACHVSPTQFYREQASMQKNFGNPFERLPERVISEPFPNRV